MAMTKARIGHLLLKSDWPPSLLSEVVMQKLEQFAREVEAECSTARVVPTKEEMFEFLCRKYVQRADDRQKRMGLQYTTAETHDLAEEVVKYLKTYQP